jgi:hypothetical protein
MAEHWPPPSPRSTIRPWTGTDHLVAPEGLPIRRSVLLVLGVLVLCGGAIDLSRRGAFSSVCPGPVGRSAVLIGAATALTVIAVVVVVMRWRSTRHPLAVLSLVAIIGTGLFVAVMWYLLLMMKAFCDSPD